MSLDPQKPAAPRQPGNNRLVWLAVAAVFLFLLGICMLGTYIVLQQFQSRTSSNTNDVPTRVLQIPTSPVDLPAPDTPTPTPFLAATATLRPTAILPIGAGNVNANPFTTPPTIDGQLNEWNGRATAESAFLVHNASSWDGSDDVTAVWQLGWDNQNLYIGAAVTDNIHVQTRADLQIFRGDSIDIQIDTDRAGDYGAGLSPDDFQLIFSPGSATVSPVVYRFRGTTTGRIPEAPGHAIQMKSARTSDGYVIEAAIPWQDLNMTPQAGLVIGLALNVNDNDQPETAVQEVMKSHVSTRTLTDPTGWGTLTLLP